MRGAAKLGSAIVNQEKRNEIMRVIYSYTGNSYSYRPSMYIGTAALAESAYKED
jgi:hypothetical protein